MADFDEIYVLDLHGNSKKKERTPVALQAQGDDKNVFDIEQGVGIVFLVKLPVSADTPPSGPTGSAGADDRPFELTAPDPDAARMARRRKLEGGQVTLKAQIRQADLWGSRDYKYAWLESHSCTTRRGRPCTRPCRNCCWCCATKMARRCKSRAGR